MIGGRECTYQVEPHNTAGGVGPGRSQPAGDSESEEGSLLSDSEPQQVEGGDRRWREAIVGGGNLKRSQVEGKSYRWREAIAFGGRQLQVEGSDLRWTEAFAGGLKRSQVD
jgi:hypothetical protein